MIHLIVYLSMVCILRYPRTIVNSDQTKPVITIKNAANTNSGHWFVQRSLIPVTYTDKGATCSDQVDGDLPIETSQDAAHPVDLYTPGTYYVRYDCTDNSGNAAATAVRTIVISEAILKIGDVIEVQNSRGSPVPPTEVGKNCELVRW